MTKMILVRATINLHGGIRPGMVFQVDDTDPEMQLHLRKGYLVPEAPTGASKPSSADASASVAEPATEPAVPLEGLGTAGGTQDTGEAGGHSTNGEGAVVQELRRAEGTDDGVSDATVGQRVPLDVPDSA